MFQHPATPEESEDSDSELSAEQLGDLLVKNGIIVLHSKATSFASATIEERVGLMRISEHVLNDPPRSEVVENSQAPPSARGPASIDNRECEPRVNPTRPKVCAWCGKTTARSPLPKLISCARCRAIRYCRRRCQSQHWEAGHRQECRVWEEQ